MPKKIVELTTEALNFIQKSVNGSNILVIGVSYKPDIDDIRESPALDIIAMLKEKGADVKYYDPYANRIIFSETEMLSLPALGSGYDCAVIVTNHSCIDQKDIINCAKTIVDTRNALKNVNPPTPLIISL
jgi:UDP-N-acetyl-D-glucosamine dehydrogenase